jgi:hypothetical protein
MINVFLFGLIGAILGAAGLGIGYGFGAQYTAARVVVMLCSAASLGGLGVTLRVMLFPGFDHEETMRTLAGFGLLVLVCGVTCAAVLS